ncbi:hypothetical protein [Trichocoleus sp. FACHB-262]|uniref:hypothetical protein n=1 Tax=Trichocoleus sp. FACHB-262 TaxID=2692869 RepID=UPI0016840B0C|nr:hypothetical protein [Trichocoleus sp. FACHB-262]MBD2120337.1 hypothetical protein [Trichocoleus sp. FACHB-262]
MNPTSQGIPSLPDLTHPQELIQFGEQGMKLFLLFVVLTGLLGVAIALLNFSLGRRTKILWTETWVTQYGLLLRTVQHATLILLITVSGFFLCSTLANRYHHWEQARIAAIASNVAGERLEHTAPQLRYTVAEPYTTTTVINGQVVEEKRTQEVSRFLTPKRTQVDVTLKQTTDPANNRLLYQVGFDGNYEVVNTLETADEFFFETSPPAGYTLLQDYRVERNGQRLQPSQQSNYSFPLRLGAGETAQFRITYQASGGPRWVYNAGSQLLSNFRLTALANFPGAQFASGIVPTKMQPEGRGTRFTWEFADNVSVLNPFGVFTATAPVRNTGVLPRLLLLAPALLLWWLLVLYLSVPLRLRDVAIASGIFFASLLTLTYLSRIIPAPFAWAILAPVMLILAWGLGRNQRASIAAAIATISGAILPVFGLLVPFTGLTLSLAGLLSVVWLTLRHWYGWQPRSLR